MISRKILEERIKWYNKTASTAFVQSSFVTITSGLLIPCAAIDVPVGFVMQNVPVTDATTNALMVDIPSDDDEFIMDVDGGTVVQTLVGTYVGISSTDPTKVDITSPSGSQILITGIIATTNQIVGTVANRLTINP